MDVEGLDFSFAIPLWRLLIPSVQQLSTISTFQITRRTMANIGSEHFIFRTVCWKHVDDIDGGPSEIARQIKGGLSTEEHVMGHEDSTTNQGEFLCGI